ncbi:MAG: 30S ribosomal protein S18 [Armatimonadetes bacterium]|nr:30S ribosomal protein S18 [Armatimonadota bacterium]
MFDDDSTLHDSDERNRDRDRGGRGRDRDKNRGRRRRRKGRPDVEKMAAVDFKDTKLLRQFVNDRGQIVPRRQTGLSARAQRLLTDAIKRARYMALLPFVVDD